MRITAAVLALILAACVAGSACAESTPQRLFHIERNTNANIVAYDVMVEPDGGLPEKDVIEVYWLRLAEDGERKGLNWIERTKAYGIKVKEREGDQLVCKMAADIGRLVTVERTDDGYRAFIDVDGRRAILEKVYIFADDGGLIPTVEYIELFGKDVETGEQAYEKYLP